MMGGCRLGAGLGARWVQEQDILQMRGHCLRFIAQCLSSPGSRCLAAAGSGCAMGGRRWRQ